MEITPTLDKWLNDVGYEYHCFISWANIKDEEMSECARQFKKRIERQLKYDIPKPQVFLDQSEITGGTIWKRELEMALCKSISMVAICAPIYYHPFHNWCGIEWTAMERLSKVRLNNFDFKAIVPVLLKKSNSMPDVVAETQYIDVSRLILRGRNYYNTIEFQNKINEIVNHIAKVAHALKSNNAEPRCGNFNFPKTSVFSGYKETNQPFPFRT